MTDHELNFKTDAEIGLPNMLATTDAILCWHEIGIWR